MAFKRKVSTKAKSYGSRMNQAEAAVNKDMGRSKGKKKSAKMC